MNTGNPVVDAQQDTTKYTAYQIEQSKTFNVHPSFFPAEEPTELGDINPTGFKRFAAPAPIVPPTPTLDEQRRQLATTFGVHAQYVQIPEGEDAEAAAARDALDAKCLARRDEIAAKYGVKPEHYHHIPLEWLDK